MKNTEKTSTEARNLIQNINELVCIYRVDPLKYFVIKINNAVYYVLKQNWKIRKRFTVKFEWDPSLTIKIFFEKNLKISPVMKTKKKTLVLTLGNSRMGHPF